MPWKRAIEIRPYYFRHISSGVKTTNSLVLKFLTFVRRLQSLYELKVSPFLAHLNQRLPHQEMIIDSTEFLLIPLQ